MTGWLKTFRLTRRGTFILLPAAIVLGFWRYHGEPAASEIAALRVRIGTAGTDKHRASGTAARVEALQVTVRQLEQRLHALQSGLGASTSVSDFIQRVETLAEKSGLTIHRLSPQPVKTGTLYTEHPHKLYVSGGYHDLVAFLDELASSEPPVIVSDVTIAARSAQASGRLVAECVISMVRLRENEAPAPQVEAAIAVKEPSIGVSAPRDPFERSTGRLTNGTADPAYGIRGVPVEAVHLTGIVRNAAGFVALIRAADKRTFTVRAGDELLDGTVRSVTASEITFNRTPADARPGAAPVQVVKRLRPVTGGR